MKLSVIEAKVSDVLTDASQVAWPQAFVRSCLAEAQRQIVTLRPDANVISESFTPAAGTSKQVLPTSDRFIDVPHNLVGGLPSKSISLVERAVLDDFDTSWPMSEPSDSILHYVFNDLVPNVFYLYPRPSVNARVELQFSRIPGAPDFTADPDLEISDAFEGAMVQYAVWRCLSRADDQSPDSASANAAYQQFMQLIGLESQSKAQLSPRNRSQKK